MRKFLSRLVTLGCIGLTAFLGWAERQPIISAISLAGIGMMIESDPAWASNCAGFTYTLTNGQTADANQVMANFNLLLTCANTNLAHNGPNSDITSLSALSTPLSVTQGGTGLGTLTSYAVPVGNGASTPTLVSPSTQGQALVSNGASANPSFGVPVQRSYLAGMTLSNDSVAPNTVLDISAGTAADSADVVTISLGAFTKSTGGAWASGSGSNGMGNGLTVQDSTWYHVFAIINGGAADVYFDTSVTGANKPAGTTALRRIGSFLTDTNGHILAFTQIGDWFWWKASIAESNISGVTLGVAATSYQLVGTPPGVNTQARMGWAITNAGSRGQLWVYPTFMNDEATGTAEGQIEMPTSAALTNGVLDVWTDTTPDVRAVAANNNSTVTARTYGYYDLRGKYY